MLEGPTSVLSTVDRWAQHKRWSSGQQSKMCISEHWLISLVQEEVPGVLSTAVQLRTALSVGAPMGADRPALCVKDYWGAQHSGGGQSRSLEVRTAVHDAWNEES
jgi:hypothetical protein